MPCRFRFARVFDQGGCQCDHPEVGRSDGGLLELVRRYTRAKRGEQDTAQVVSVSTSHASMLSLSLREEKGV